MIRRQCPFFCLLLVFPVLLHASLSAFIQSSHRETENLVLITLDGLRRQEIFQGADERLLMEKPELQASFGGASAEEKRTKLMPFFWSEVASKGVILGNQERGSRVLVANPHRFSYPGYAEILTGQVLEEIDSNDPVRISRQTVLEFIREELELASRDVAVFSSWSIMGYIVSSREGAIFSNAGYEKVPREQAGSSLHPVNSLQEEMLTPWDSVRHDAVTFRLALEYLKQYQPSVLYLALGETDDWAHEGRYDRVLQMIQVTDGYLRELWQTLHSLEKYRNRTTLILTSDHGRGGGPDDWTRHGKDVSGAEFTWLAAIGPDTPARGESSRSPDVSLKNVAATLLALLGIDYRKYDPSAGPPISLIMEN